jgi:hypothetical protein
MEPERAPEATRRAGRASFVARVGHELRTHVVAYAVLAVFVAAGPLAVSWLFPGVTPWAGVVGGLALGIYAALCAVPDRFYE